MSDDTDTLDGDTLDRDIIVTTAPTNPTEGDDHDSVRRIIAHRVPEIEPGEIADAYSIVAEAEAGQGVWLEIADRVIDTLEASEERLDRLERTINGEDDDDDATTRPARQAGH